MKPMTWEQYQASLANGWTDDDLKQQGYEIPSPPSASAPQPKAQGGYGRLQELGQSMLSPRKWGEAAMSALGAIPGSDEVLGVAAGGQAALRGQNPIKEYSGVQKALSARFKQADSASGDLGTAARIATMALPVGALGEAAKAIPVATRAGPVVRALSELGAGAASGGLYGGAAGALNAEDGERLKGGAVGGGAGLLLGALLTALPMGVRGAADYLGLNKRGVQSRRVSEAANEVLDRQSIPAEKLRGDFSTTTAAARQAPEAWGASSRLREAPGAYASGKRVMDTSPEMQELAKDAANASPEAERMLGVVARTRQSAQNPALAEDFAVGIGAKPGVNAERVRDAITDATASAENKLYPKLFQSFPNPVETEQAVTTWQMAEGLLPKYATAVQRNQQLASQPMSDILQTVGETPVPTLEGLHRLKVLTGSAIRALSKQEAAGTLGDDGVALQRSLSLFQDRVRDALETAPGGDIYAQIQAMGAQERGVVDALEKGLELGGAKMRGYTATEAMQNAMQRTPQGGATALRQGAATRVANDAAAQPFDSKAILNQLAKEPATQEAVDALAKDPAAAAQFAKNMKDRLAMAETDALQMGGATKQKEILKGSRARGTALGYGEAGALGQALAGNPMGAMRGAKLAGGALLAKALEGFRGKGVRAAGDELASVLVQNAGSTAVPGIYFDMLLANARLQQQRLARAARIGGAAGATSSSQLKR